MPQRTFNQFNINRTPNNQQIPAGFRKLNLTLMCEPSNGYLSFYFDGFKEDEAGVQTAKLNINIDENYEVIIKLDEGTQWHWSNTLSAITTKRQLRQFYTDLQYSEDGVNFFYYDDEILERRHRYIRFFARYNNNPVNPPQNGGDRHPFSLNVSLITDEVTRKILPITIDPDIKNPPPGPGLQKDRDDEKTFLSAEFV